MQTGAGECAERGRGRSEQHQERSCVNGTAASPRGCKRGGLQQGGSALGMGMQPWQGRAEQARQAVPGKGGGHCRWPGPGPGGCASRRPRAPCLGHLPGGWGVLTSRAQHLEQLEVLHAHLLLMPRQVGCRHRGRMSPAVHDPSLWPPQPSPHPAAPGGPCPTFRDPQLHSTALVFVLVPHGEWVAGARGSAPGGAGYMAAPTGAGASWCRLRADSGASAAS